MERADIVEIFIGVIYTERKCFVGCISVFNLVYYKLVFSVCCGVGHFVKQWSSSLELRKHISHGIAWAMIIFSLIAFILETLGMLVLCVEHGAVMHEQCKFCLTAFWLWCGAASPRSGASPSFSLLFCFWCNV